MRYVPSSVSPASPAQRYLEVDLLKGAGIVAVVVIHSLRGFWVPEFSTLELWIGQVTRFGVPAFLAVSGFLYAAPAVSGAKVKARLLRILIPYAIASLLAIVWGLARGPLSLPPTELLESLGAHSTSAQMGLGIPLDFLFGSAFGPYYYVFVISLFVVLSPWIAKAGRSLGILVIIAVALQGLLESGVLGWFGLFWYSRNPLLWSAYFLIGWWIGLHYGEVSRFVAHHRRSLLSSIAALLLACAALLAFEAGGNLPHALVQLCAWLGVYAAIALLFCCACGHTTRAPWLASLSDLTFTIYLYHLFFLYPLRDALEAVPAPFETWPLALTATATLAASVAFGLGVRALFKERARLLFGA